MSRKSSKATMQDVADLAQVSLATVSHVINGTRFVRPDTSEQVMAAIGQTGYIPNSLARALARNSTSSVGLVLSWASNPYFLDIVTTIEQMCHRAGITVLMSDTSDDPDKQLRIVQDMHQRRVDGIIIALCSDPEERTLNYLRSNHIPVVLVDRLAAADFDQVGVDNIQAMNLLVDHLVNHNHRRIALVAGHDGYATSKERIEAYLQRMAYHNLSEFVQVSAASNTSKAAMNSTLSLISGEARPQALIAGNNLSTVGAMSGIRKAGLHVPEDIVLVGIDDFEWADCFEPRLTVIAQPCQEIGKQAAAMMQARINDPSAEPSTLRLEPSLIVRNSCGCNN